MPISAGDTAWILMSAALVMLMTPGVALFYGGMVRRKNVLSTIMMSFIALALVGLLWILYGYSLSFGTDIGGLIGGFNFFGLGGGGGGWLVYKVGHAGFCRRHRSPYYRRCLRLRSGDITRPT